MNVFHPLQDTICLLAGVRSSRSSKPSRKTETLEHDHVEWHSPKVLDFDTVRILFAKQPAP
jgi:hypothetical protein